MAKKIEAIGVLTGGGSTPDMNVAVHTVAHTALHYGMKAKDIMRGCSDLLDRGFIDMNARSVANIIDHGGTILYMARYVEMVTGEGQRQAAKICKKHGVDGVVVIDDDDPLKSAGKLSKLDINTIGVPGIINLDIAYIEYTISFDTTANAAIDATDKVRGTSTSCGRCLTIEVMGRRAGYIALWSDITTDSDVTLIPEHYNSNEQGAINHVIVSRKRGRKHFIIINAKGIGHSGSIAKRIEATAGTETRAAILGYMWRDSSSSYRDRFYASVMGSKTVGLPVEGKLNCLVAYRDGEFCDLDTEEALRVKEDIPVYQLELSVELTH